MAALLPIAASAQDSLSGAEFDSYSRGKTFYYGAGGQPYGAEEYFSDRRVIWSFLDGHCQEGRWYEDQGNICFVYDEHPDPQCWRFRLGATGLTAQFQGPSEGGTSPLYEIQSSPEPMTCEGPEVGV
ncbi:hypothetical protein KM176_17115 [Pseudooceanicola sp. CBS1P-1]|uniref:DUF995 domain-containing protein n=2 Tax=Paracoccaceae TaxID=31989 RepID=A0A6L7G4F7_9RHOB|nr:hypothetical protein [Pseudooceanicola endophyticus]MXN18995.1 hypothetical protein [Pseudooceanicola albus]